MDLPRGDVDGQPVPAIGCDALGGRLQIKPAQHGADAGHQLEVVERLADVVVRTGLQPAHLVNRLVAGGEHDDRHGAERANLAQHAVAVHVGEADVEQHEVRSLRLDARQRIGSVVGLEDLDVAPLQLEAEANRAADLRVVVDQQQLHFRGHSTLAVVKVLPLPTSLSTSMVPP